MNHSTTEEDILRAFYAETFGESSSNAASKNTNTMFEELDSVSRVELFERLKRESEITTSSLEDFLRAKSFKGAVEDEAGEAPSSNGGFFGEKIGQPITEAKITIGEILFSIVAYLVFTLISTAAFIALLLPTSARRRRKLVHACATGIFLLLRTKIQVRGKVPSSQVIAVSNHESYLDSIVLYALLPPDFHFIAKEELTRFTFLKLSLSRIGTYFVDRNDLSKSYKALFKLQEGVEKRSESLHFFPESTFLSVPGLLPFKHGAFYLSCKTKVPILPIKLEGTRRALSPGSWIIRRGLITVIMGEALSPKTDSWDEVVSLKKKVFSFISR